MAAASRLVILSSLPTVLVFTCAGRLFFLLRQPIAPGTGDFEFLRFFPCTGDFEFLRNFPCTWDFKFLRHFPVLESPYPGTLSFYDIFPYWRL